MKIVFYQPKNNILKRYIEGYYFMLPDDTNQPFHYFTFPNNFFILSVAIGSQIMNDDRQIIISKSETNEIIADYLSRYTEPIELLYKNSIPEITIYFKPSGINHFIEKAHLLFEQGNSIDFNPFPDFFESMKEILELKNHNLQIELLEEYWLSKFKQKNLELVEAILLDMESDMKIADIASKHKISRQHLNSLFTKTVGKSCSEYRKINRFRSAIEKKKSAKNLTQLTYDNLFYDQSHMVKDFKELTKASPHSFFKKIDIDKKNIWLYI
ncbi:helix-turn-helix domain-containing protein [Epilithonimonas hominis]|uniref:Helix-turn-helix domain-containing protein n=1 Tax=Epilithonimonas hominis TaxID=420404 RepID=A0A3N0X7P0_9FLAO|nr:helix-turn-helix domain-containing protein [Epilithonimonas hominis]ROI13303.1 helix-turn-helix domain-containing protein [Epilithonimonas hominis]